MPTVREIATWLDAEYLGDGDTIILAAKPLTDAGEGDLTFLDDVKQLAKWHGSNATAAIVPESVSLTTKSIIRVPEPMMAFIDVYRRMHVIPNVAPKHNIHPSATIDPTATISATAIIGPQAVIEANASIGDYCQIDAGCFVGHRVKIGAKTRLYSHVVVGDDCIVGNRCLLYSNAVIGSDGFGYRLVKGQHVKVPQMGIVIVGDDVEIGACTSIDRGTFGPTIIGDGTKIDNLVQIAHNCTIGKHNILCSQVGIAGSTSTGDYVVMAGQVGVKDHVHIGEKSVLGAQSGISKDVPPNSRMFGTPATPDREQMKMIMMMHKLPEMRRDLKLVLDHLKLNDLKEAA